MVFDSAEIDDAGQWTGTCESCGTDHGGYLPGSLGAEVACLRARSEALGAGHLVDQIDAGRRDLAAHRDRTLRDLGLIP